MRFRYTTAELFNKTYVHVSTTSLASREYEMKLTRDALVDDLDVVGEAVAAVHPADVDHDATSRPSDARAGQTIAQIHRHRLHAVARRVPTRAPPPTLATPTTVVATAALL